MPDLANQFLAFCRSKPADEAYDGGDLCACALAQFGKPYLTSFSAPEAGIPAEVYWAAINTPCTFGALTTRLEATLSGERA